MFGHDPRTWVDESALAVEGLWDLAGCPPIYSGHMHRRVDDGPCHILEINEVRVLE
jgi:hypothetical protein